MRRLATHQGGFGLVELLIAMTVMVIAIMAIVAAFSSGMVAVTRASRASTAATLADIRMEGYRKVRYTDALLAPACLAPSPCFGSSNVPGPDNRTYRIDTAVRWDCPTATVGGTVAVPTCAGARVTKLVTIIVYDPSTTPPKELFRENSTFDQATG